MVASRVPVGIIYAQSLGTSGGDEIAVGSDERQRKQSGDSQQFIGTECRR
jgi:hypothetical protein